MTLNAYLNFNGQCEAAFQFYERCFGGKILMRMTYGESPMGEKTAPELRNRIVHITMAVGDGQLMGSDVPPDFFEKPQGFAVHIAVSDTAEAERLFQALSENASVRMPMQKTFWAERFGMLTDQFGTPWMVNCTQPAKER